jgi:hypothetical protein
MPYKGPTGGYSTVTRSVYVGDLVIEELPSRSGSVATTDVVRDEVGERRA